MFTLVYAGAPCVFTNLMQNTLLACAAGRTLPLSRPLVQAATPSPLILVLPRRTWGGSGGRQRGSGGRVRGRGGKGSSQL